MQNTSIITISTRDRLPSVAVLAESLRKHHPDHKLICYLIEREVDPADSFNGLFEVIGIKDIALPGGDNFLFQYSAFELCCACKPLCIMDQIIRHKTDNVIFLDGDMLVCAPFLDILDNAQPKYSFMVTPHLTQLEKEIDFSYFAKPGVYNAGFMFARNDTHAMNLMKWWQKRVQKDCVYDYLGGAFAEQTWLGWAMLCFDNAGPITHRGINVGHWNMHECDFRELDGNIMVNENDPLCVFHFSSFQNPGLTKHETIKSAIPPLIQRLADSYENSLNMMKKRQEGNIAYSFGKFKDGSPVTPAMREAVRLQIISTNNPFEERTKIEAALPHDDPDSILDKRVDHRVYRLDEKCRILKLQIENIQTELQTAREHAARIRKHPVIGRIMTFWARYINKDLLDGFPESDR